MELDKKKVAELMEKIPKSDASEKVILPLVFFKNLSDDEFTILWLMPGIDIIVTPKVLKYIEKRRRSLKLVKNKHNSPGYL